METNILEKLRLELDKIDEEIIKKLKERFDIVKQIWEYKKQNNIKALQPERWKKVLNSRKNIAKKYNISEKFIEKIWNEIHKEALEIEK